MEKMNSGCDDPHGSTESADLVEWTASRQMVIHDKWISKLFGSKETVEVVGKRVKYGKPGGQDEG